MGVFNWISNIFTTVYNYIVDYFYPNNIVANRQPTPEPVDVAVVEEIAIQEPNEPIITPTVAESPDNNTLQYTITDENENEIYSSVAQTTDIDNKIIQLNYQKQHVVDEDGELVRPDPLVNINTGLSRLMLNTVGIKHLNLNGAGIDTAGLVTLAGILSRDNISLESLNLANNNRNGSKINDPGLRALFEALGNNKTLKNINLQHTNIQNDIIESIANCFAKNSTLVTIDLSYNNIYARGLRYILSAIQRNFDSSIRDISLVDNSIYDYNVGMNPEHDDAIVSRNARFALGDQNAVYRFINEISESIKSINSVRDSNRNSALQDKLAFLTFTKCNVVNKKNKCSVLGDDMVYKVSEMLFTRNSLRKTEDNKKFFIKIAQEPIVVNCPAKTTWAGPRIS